MIFKKGELVKVLSGTNESNSKFIGKVGRIHKVSMETPYPFLVYFYDFENIETGLFNHKELVLVEGYCDSKDRLEFSKNIRKFERNDK